MLKPILPYLIAALLGALAGAGCMHLVGSARLAAERAAHARDDEQHARDMLAVSRAALEGEQRAIDAHNVAQDALAAADAAITKEKDAHEADNRNYRSALAAGTERVRVAVRNCSATGSGDATGPSGAAGVGYGAAAVADLDPAVAERVFGVAGDDQREIDKVKVLQAYVCAVRPHTPGC
ncbi:lysis system i-spanin subunit Rz [Paraburkholderia silviterrae]|uniref:Lysozyme n=1 Tax=Paraburkholderia silviterrae TaxID=2528715 RepID=A0A4R5MFG7_9BURK|nr:lysis system i-spanin subunit Rz [Paraburkholderia silviterrae]TDG25377.1 lysozyme [Paraburkholderia silviterrae]